MRLRVLDFGYDSAVRSQAIYHGIANAMGVDDDPVLTLVNPTDPYVCVGLHQEVALEVDEEFCKQQQLPVIRRHVGGGTVYLDENQMFFHFIYPRNKAPLVADELYPMFIEPVLRTYKDLGVNASFRPVNDIQVNGKKIGGTGAASIENATVMVGSFLFDFNTAQMAKALKVPSEKFRDKLFTTLEQYMTTMKKELKEVPTRDKVKYMFLHHVANCLRVDPVESFASVEELNAIDEQEKILVDPEWTYQLGKKFVAMGVKISADVHLTEGSHKAPGGLIRAQLLAKNNHIDDLLISGDFTCLPANGVFALCEKLKGVALEQDALVAVSKRAIKLLALDIPGVQAEDIATAIMNAVHKEK